jgi:BTB/POZ domain
MKEDLFQDVTLIIGSERKAFNMNLTVFSLFSPKIRQMMKMAFESDNILQEIEFRDINPSDFVFIDQLLKKGRVRIGSDNALRVLRMSTYFSINCLKEFVVRVIEQDEDLLSSLDLYIFAFEADSKRLMELSMIRMAE